jgi:hypothetical protein
VKFPQSISSQKTHTEQKTQNVKRENLSATLTESIVLIIVGFGRVWNPFPSLTVNASPNFDDLAFEQKSLCSKNG